MSDAHSIRKFVARQGRHWFAASLVIFIWSAGLAQALEPAAARQHVDATISDIVDLIVDSPGPVEAASRLQEIVERRSAVDQVAHFAAGRYWRTMTAEEQARFERTFSRYIASIYAGHFRRFEGDAADLRKYVHTLGVRDATGKGVLVRTEITPLEGVPISIDWLVSDRSGRVAISDLIVEGISMAITQREVVGAMLDARDGDVDRLIIDLERRIGSAGN